MQHIQHVFQLLVFLFITQKFGWLMDTDYTSYNGNYRGTTKAINEEKYYESSSEDYEESLSSEDKAQNMENAYTLNHPTESITQLLYTGHSLNTYTNDVTPYSINGHSSSWMNNNGNTLLLNNKDTLQSSTVQSLNQNGTKILYDSTITESTPQSSIVYSLNGTTTTQEMYTSATYSTIENNSANYISISSSPSSEVSPSSSSVSIQTMSVNEKFKNENNGYSTTINTNHFSTPSIQSSSNNKSDNLPNIELVNTYNHQNYGPQLIRKSFNTSYITGDTDTRNMTSPANATAVIVLPNATEGEDIIPLSSLTDTSYLLDSQPLNDTETSETFIMNTYSESALESEDLVASANNFAGRNMLENSTYIGYDNISRIMQMESLNVTTKVPILRTNQSDPPKMDADYYVSQHSNHPYKNDTDFNITQTIKNNLNPKNDLNNNQTTHLNFSFEPKQFLFENSSSVETGKIKTGLENFTTQTTLKDLNHSDVYTAKSFELPWAPVANVSFIDHLSDTEMKTIPTEKSNHPILTTIAMESQNNEFQEKFQHRSIEDRNISVVNLSEILKIESIKSNESNHMSFNGTKLLQDSHIQLSPATINPSLLKVFDSINESTQPWVEAPFFNDFKPVHTGNATEFPSRSNVSTTSTTITNPTILSISSSTHLPSEIERISLSSVIANNSSISNFNSSLPNFKGITMFKLGIEDARPSSGINLSQRLLNQTYPDKLNDTIGLKIEYNYQLPSSTFGNINGVHGNPTYAPTVNSLPNSYPSMETNESQSYMLTAFSMDSPKNISYTNNNTNFQEEKVIETHFNKNVGTQQPNVSLSNYLNPANDQWQNTTANTLLLKTNSEVQFGYSILNFKDNVSQNNISLSNRSLLKENTTSEANETLVRNMYSKSNEHLQILAPPIFNTSESLSQPNISQYYVTITSLDTTNNQQRKQETHLPVTDHISNVSYIESHLNVNNSDFLPIIVRNNNSSTQINGTESKQIENFNSRSSNNTATSISYRNQPNSTFFDFKAYEDSNKGNFNSSHLSDIRKSGDKNNRSKELPILPTPISLGHTSIQPQTNTKSVRKRSANVIKELMTYLSNKTNINDPDYSTPTTEHRLSTKMALDNSMEESDISDMISNLKSKRIVPKPCGIKGKGSFKSRISRKYAVNMTAVGEMCWHAVLLRNPDLSYFCGGVVIGGKWILTTGNCVIRLKPDDFIVRLGEWNLQDKNELPGSLDYNVSFISIHPEFNASTLENDLALIKLSDFPDLSLSSVCQICLPDDSWRHHNYATKKCSVTGFGMDTQNGEYSNIMKITSTVLLDQTSCTSKLNGTLQKDGMTVLCGTNGNIYFGDGGGPLFCEDSDHSVLAGVVSWTYLQSVTGFTKISNYLSWIQETMEF